MPVENILGKIGTASFATLSEQTSDTTAAKELETAISNYVPQHNTPQGSEQPTVEEENPKKRKEHDEDDDEEPKEINKRLRVQINEMYAYMANMTQRLERMERNNNHGHPQSHVDDTELKEKMREVINEIEINKYMEAKFNPLPTSDKNLLAQYKTLKATLTTSDLNNKERVTATSSESEGTQLVRERRRAHVLRVLRDTQRPLNHAINSDNGGEEETKNLKNIVMDTTKRLQHATQSCSRLKTIIETLNMDNMKLREEADSNHKEMLELLEENTMLKTKNNELQTKNNSL